MRVSGGSVLPSAAAAVERVAGRPPDAAWSAPGRVNLIGEHTDYNDGLVLPFAIPARTTVAVARRTDDLLVLRSLQRPDDVVELPLAALTPGHPGGWAGYVAGVVWSLRRRQAETGGLDVVVDGTVPAGSGLSSSAALECATAGAVADVAGADLTPAELARVAQEAENAFVGVPCGLMDQMAAMCCRENAALFFDVRAGETADVPLSPVEEGLALLVVDTRARHALADGGYAQRRQQCAAAAAALGVGSLRDVSLDDLDAALARLDRTPVLARRVRHVVTENARVRAVVALLGAGALGRSGPVLDASHASLRDDYEVSAPELDAAVEAARGAGAVGARMTGGGFGGSVLAVVPVESVAAVASAVAAAAAGAGFPVPVVAEVSPSPGARREV